MDSCDSPSRSTYNDGYRLGYDFKCLYTRNFSYMSLNPSFIANVQKACDIVCYGGFFMPFFRVKGGL